jgi:hypothetical protein
LFECGGMGNICCDVIRNGKKVGAEESCIAEAQLLNKWF